MSSQISKDLIAKYCTSIVAYMREHQVSFSYVMTEPSMEAEIRVAREAVQAFAYARKHHVIAVVQHYCPFPMKRKAATADAQIGVKDKQLARKPQLVKRPMHIVVSYYSGGKFSYEGEYYGDVDTTRTCNNDHELGSIIAHAIANNPELAPLEHAEVYAYVSDETWSKLDDKFRARVINERYETCAVEDKDEAKRLRVESYEKFERTGEVDESRYEYTPIKYMDRIKSQFTAKQISDIIALHSTYYGRFAHVSAKYRNQLFVYDLAHIKSYLLMRFFYPGANTMLIGVDCGIWRMTECLEVKCRPIMGRYDHFCVSPSKIFNVFITNKYPIIVRDVQSSSGWDRKTERINLNRYMPEHEIAFDFGPSVESIAAFKAESIRQDSLVSCLDDYLIGMIIGHVQGQRKANYNIIIKHSVKLSEQDRKIALDLHCMARYRFISEVYRDSYNHHKESHEVEWPFHNPPKSLYGPYNFSFAS